MAISKQHNQGRYNLGEYRMKDLTEGEKAIVTKYDLYFEGRLSKAEATLESFDKRMNGMSNDIKDIKTDIRWLIGIMLCSYGSLFALMAHGFKWF